MKKALAGLFAIVFILSLSAGVYAESREKVMEVSITASADTINVGETAILKAVTAKHGSSCTDSWNGAEPEDTLLDPEEENYVSTSAFTADYPGIYTITYTIEMEAGKSGTAFTGKAEYTIEVTGAVKVTGAEIRDLYIQAITRSDGSIAGYSAAGDVYILRSDGTAELYNTVFFYFGPNETSKQVQVSFEADGETYRYTVTVEREQA